MTKAEAVVTLDDCLSRPEWVADELRRACPCVGEVSVAELEHGVAFVLELLPLRGLEAHGYEAETIRVMVCDDGRPFAMVPSDGRGWKHTYDGFYFCLWDPDDPPQLQWDWSMGFATYVWVVARHVMYEEYNRREGEWPVEDSPHGRGAHPHPIVTPWLRAVAGQGLSL